MQRHQRQTMAGTSPPSSRSRKAREGRPDCDDVQATGKLAGRDLRKKRNQTQAGRPGRLRSTHCYTGGVAWQVSEKRAARAIIVLRRCTLRTGLSCGQEQSDEQTTGFCEEDAVTSRRTCLRVPTHETCVQEELRSQTKSIQRWCSEHERYHPSNKKGRCSWLYGVVRTEGRRWLFFIHLQPINKLRGSHCILIEKTPPAPAWVV